MCVCVRAGAPQAFQQGANLDASSSKASVTGRGSILIAPRRTRAREIKPMLPVITEELVSQPPTSAKWACAAEALEGEVGNWRSGDSEWKEKKGREKESSQPGEEEQEEAIEARERDGTHINGPDRAGALT
ncbi:hypothetical protein H0H87_004835 [Tephrocybe sp. NHM501043]|nr:hypothetical protein H0H87_004835 [Tephrocybe sp. NHM501043]